MQVQWHRLPAGVLPNESHGLEARATKCRERARLTPAPALSILECTGGVAEWTKAAVLKTAVPFCGTGGSNPSPSAKHELSGPADFSEWQTRSLQGRPPG